MDKLNLYFVFADEELTDSERIELISDDEMIDLEEVERKKRKKKKKRREEPPEELEEEEIEDEEELEELEDGPEDDEEKRSSTSISLPTSDSDTSSSDTESERDEKKNDDATPIQQPNKSSKCHLFIISFCSRGDFAKLNHPMHKT